MTTHEPSVINFTLMQSKEYKNIADFIAKSVLPAKLDYTAGNFKRKANKFNVNKKNELMRDGKLVVKYSERSKIFEVFHQVLF